MVDAMKLQRMRIVAAAILTVAISVVLAACGGSAQRSSSSINPNGPLFPLPMGSVRSRVVFHLNRSGPVDLLVYSTRGTKAQISVYRLHANTWTRLFSRTGLNGTLPNGGGQGSFTVVDPAHLMDSSTEQFGINEWSTGADAGTTILIVYGLAGGRIAPLLVLQDSGSLLAQAAGSTLFVSGSYYPPGACLACGTAMTVSIRYDAQSGQWVGVPKKFFAELSGSMDVLPPPSVSPPSAAGPSVTFGTGFNSNTFTLTGQATTFVPGVIDALLITPTSFDSSTLSWILEQKEGVGWSLYDSGTITVLPTYDELEKPIYMVSAGTFQLSFLRGNTILASGTFTVEPPPSSPSYSAPSYPSSSPSPSSVPPSPSPSPSSSSLPPSSPSFTVSPSPSPSPTPSSSYSSSPSSSSPSNTPSSSSSPPSPSSSSSPSPAPSS